MKIENVFVLFSRRAGFLSLGQRRNFFRNMSLRVSQPPGDVIQVGEFRLHYEKIGQGDNCLFLMPGALGSTRTHFEEQLNKFDFKKFTVIAWDPPGYGYSRPPERTFPLDVFHRDADVAAQLLGKVLPVDKKETSVVGWSDGGITALILAAKYPQLVRRLVVFGTNAYITQEDVILYENVRDVSTWNPRMRAPMEQVYGVEYFKELWNKWLDATVAIHKKNEGGNICKECVSAISCPTLVFHGKQDNMVPQNHPDFLRENIKNVRYIELEDGKHNLHQKYADLFNHEVEKFLLD